jgi:hypothetical protein
MDELEMLRRLTRWIEDTPKREPQRYALDPEPMQRCIHCSYREPQGSPVCEVCPSCDGVMVPERWH